MRKTDGCKLFGAYQALAGIKDCIILFHSVVGCHFGTLGLHLNHCPVEIHQASTLMGNKEVIFGGAEAIRQALETVLRESKIRTICLISGCISELIEDDLDAICREYEERLRLIVIHAPGFEGGITEGYEDALLSLSCFLEPKLGTQKWDGRRINVFGLGTDDYCARGDWKQIQNLLGEQVILNPCPPFCSVEDVKGLAQADLTLVFGRGKKLAEYLQKNFGILYEVLPYPYGFSGMKELWKILEQYLECDYSGARQEAEAALKRELLMFYPYMESLYYSNFAVYAEDGRLNGLIRFLEEELGMRKVLAKPLHEPLSMQELDASKAVILFATSYERKMARSRDLPLIRVGYPVLDRVCSSTDTMIGVGGTVTLVKEIINQTLELWSGKDGALL